MIRVVRSSTLRRLKLERERFRIRARGNEKRVDLLSAMVDSLIAEVEHLRTLVPSRRDP